MSIHKKLAAAALSGLLSTTFVAGVALAADAVEPEKTAVTDQKAEKHSCKGKSGCGGMAPTEEKETPATPAPEEKK